jgi:AraC family transcriptional regulator of adaptative response/methylated-DNA-[protein]-cysteine methyltransferase
MNTIPSSAMPARAPLSPSSSSAAERAAAVERDPRWPAVRTRDAAADGRFVYSVRTTGVYCRPSCPARPARPENIAFHADPAAAEVAGFRPCKRCRPDGEGIAARQAAIVAALCRHMDESEQVPNLDELAARAGWSPFHLHRVFKAITGVTPRAYASAQRGGRVRQQLQSGASVTDALYGAGYGSGGRFYAESDRRLGMTPGRFRAGGDGSTIRFALGQCTLGAILVAQSERGLCAITLGDDADALLRELQDCFPRARLIGGDADFEALVARVVGLVEAPRLGLDLPLDVRGTAFQQRVWQALREIPPGSTASYAEIAQRIGTPKAVRAVAQACAANVLAVAIPCHRVVRQDGALSGYRWGVERKRTLLAREGSDA